MKKNRREKPIKLYKTFPLAATHRIDPVTKATIPPEDSIEQTKEWVDFNQK